MVLENVQNPYIPKEEVDQVAKYILAIHPLSMEKHQIFTNEPLMD